MLINSYNRSSKISNRVAKTKIKMGSSENSNLCQQQQVVVVIAATPRFWGVVAVAAATIIGVLAEYQANRVACVHCTKGGKHSATIEHTTLYLVRG